MSSHPAHLEPSELGTKEYWDKLYTTELRNHAADSSDIGTCWFDDSDAEARILRFLRSLTPDVFPTSASSDSDDDDDDDDDDNDNGGDEEEEEKSKTRTGTPLSRSGTSFLDLGCGNGALLFALRDAGWQGRMLGIDYSPQSISLAHQIARSRADNTPSTTDADTTADTTADTIADADSCSGSPGIEFAEWDLIAGPMSVPGPQPWDVVLDKGTFDAISLSGPGAVGAAAYAARRPVESYRERMLALVRPGGLFVVTSCNWTEDELRAWFERGRQGQGEGEAFTVVGRVDYPTFTFGGVKGQTITTLCFQRGR
ncbi:N-lysine methyltransferase SEE1 [Escovopsis weberi]|uniref:Protein-lysine N-methyltransferase EFM4 n=1 Tax=Escovopsis weberi TaxID=150374 RepID=A0A0M9VT84_ESCWE|nr:N-lysine methyltransferase SEE1 [Escovopsis weberi]